MPVVGPEQQYAQRVRQSTATYTGAQAHAIGSRRRKLLLEQEWPGVHRAQRLERLFERGIAVLLAAVAEAGAVVDVTRDVTIADGVVVELALERVLGDRFVHPQAALARH